MNVWKTVTLNSTDLWGLKSESLLSSICETWGMKMMPLESSLGLRARCSCSHVKNCFLSWIPLLSWLPHYSLRENAFGDGISGISVGIKHLPSSKRETLIHLKADLRRFLSSFLFCSLSSDTGCEHCNHYGSGKWMVVCHANFLFLFIISF